MYLEALLFIFIFFVSANFFIDYNSRLIHFSITEIPRVFDFDSFIRLVHCFSLEIYKFVRDQRHFIFIYFYLVFDITTYITTIHQGGKKDKN